MIVAATVLAWKFYFEPSNHPTVNSNGGFSDLESPVDISRSAYNFNQTDPVLIQTSDIAGQPVGGLNHLAAVDGNSAAWETFSHAGI